jgi:hypothetical protein
MPDARPFSSLPGGREAFDEAHARIAAAAAAAQERLSMALDAIGPPGAARWDPIAGEIELRGKVLRAEQLGSFDGSSWLWSWANPHLEIPEAKTTVARRLRDSKAVAAFAEPMIQAADERLPYMMGDFAIASSGVDGYWLADHSQVYVIKPGQLVIPTSRRLALCFLSRSLTLDHLRKALGGLPFRPASGSTLELSRGGLTVRLKRCDALKDVLREATQAGPVEAAAKLRSCVVVVETAMEPSYAGPRYGPFMGTWAPVQVQDLGPDVRGPQIGDEAVQACEALARLPGALVFDLVLRLPYEQG